jgi:hypothetical protein
MTRLTPFVALRESRAQPILSLVSTTMMIHPAHIAGVHEGQTTARSRRSRRLSRARKAYDTALGATELASWEASGHTVLPGRSTVREAKSTALPRPSTNHEGENALYAMVVFAVVSALVFGGTESLHFTEHWHQVMQFVRSLIG